MTDEAPGAWCPKCLRRVPLDDPELLVEFGPQVVRLQRGGSLDLGEKNDVFLDYTHMECGTKVRIMSNARWDQELGDYGPDPSPMLEVTIDDEYVVPDTEEGRALGQGAFSGTAEDAPDEWGPTVSALFDAYEAALTDYQRLWLKG